MYRKNGTQATCGKKLIGKPVFIHDQSEIDTY